MRTSVVLSIILLFVLVASGCSSPRGKVVARIADVMIRGQNEYVIVVHRYTAQKSTGVFKMLTMGAPQISQESVDVYWYRNGVLILLGAIPAGGFEMAIKEWKDASVFIQVFRNAGIAEVQCDVYEVYLSGGFNKHEELTTTVQNHDFQARDLSVPGLTLDDEGVLRIM